MQDQAEEIQCQPVFRGFACPVGMSCMPAAAPSSCIFWVGTQVPSQTPSPPVSLAQDEHTASVEQDVMPMAIQSSKPRKSKHANSKRTTLMMRNLPNNMSRDMLMDLLDAQGFGLAVDFLYLPMDFQRRAGFGYAFVNCTTPADAENMLDHFHLFSDWTSSTSHKICEVVWCAHSQGLNAQLQRFRNNTVMHASVPDEFKPILLKNGVRKTFPPPTRTIEPPEGLF
jgi:hypothetical protein